MFTTSRAASDVLQPLIEEFWSVDVSPADSVIRPEKIVPNGTINLIFNLSGCPHREYDLADLDRWFPLRDRWLSGIRDQCVCIGPTVRTHVVGIRFRPGGLAPFLPMPVSEITNRTVDLDLIWGPGIACVHEQLGTAATTTLRFDILERWLLEQVGPDLPVDARLHHCLARLHQHAGAVTVQELAAEVNLSPKQLRRYFEASVGLGPKRLSRVLRLQQVVQTIEASNGRTDWAALAVGAGYYDQAHLITEFRRLAGMTPTQYLRNKTSTPNFVAVAD